MINCHDENSPDTGAYRLIFYALKSANFIIYTLEHKDGKWRAMMKDPKFDKDGPCIYSVRIENGIIYAQMLIPPFRLVTLNYGIRDTYTPMTVDDMIRKLIGMQEQGQGDKVVFMTVDNCNYRPMYMETVFMEEEIGLYPDKQSYDTWDSADEESESAATVNGIVVE